MAKKAVARKPKVTAPPAPTLEVSFRFGFPNRGALFSLETKVSVGGVVMSRGEALDLKEEDR